MPPRRKRSAEKDGEEIEDVDAKPTDGDLDGPANKKGKTEAGKKEVEGVGEVFENEEGNTYIKLGEYKRLTVRKWKDMVLVDIREFYKDKKDGQIKPGSKGISLTPEQWAMVKQNTDTVDDLLKQIK